MNRLVRMLVLFLSFVLYGANAESAPTRGCAGGEVARVRLAFQRISQGTLNDVTGSIGFFRLTNASDTTIPLSGWIREGVLWLEYPVATIQVKDGAWKDVTPMLGSFMTDGDDKRTVAPGESLPIAARVDFGIPPEAQMARLVINLSNKTCIISAPFALPSRGQ